MTHIRVKGGEPMTIGEEVAVKLSQRTLVLILGVAVAAGAAYADLKSDAKTSRDLVKEMEVQRALDHDLLTRVAAGVEQLQRESARRDYRDTRGTKTSSNP